MGFEPQNGRHEDATEKVRLLKQQFELVGKQVELLGLIAAELEASRPQPEVYRGEVYRLAPDDRLY